MSRVGILAYGSLINDPEAEITAATDYVISDVETPFEVEYARKSTSRSYAPTLIPVPEGKGAKVHSSIFVLKPEITREDAETILYRRELHRVGDLELKYVAPAKPSPDRLTIEIVENLRGIERVLNTRFGNNLPEILEETVAPEDKASQLAELAIASVTEETFATQQDGIWYLARAIAAGIQTPLTSLYRQAILQRAAGASDLDEARLRIARNKGIRIQAILPPNVYRLAQRRFDAIPGSPWVYWVSHAIRSLFESLPNLSDVAQPCQGLATADNSRFLRFWWEVGHRQVHFGCFDREEARTNGKRWFPYMKGGERCRWYGNQEHVVNWQNDGAEIQKFYGPDGRLASRPQNTHYFFREGLTWTDLGASGFAARISPGGFVFDVSGSCAFPENLHHIPGLLAVMNAGTTGYLLGLLNPTMHFQVGDLSRLPIPDLGSTEFDPIVGACIRLAKINATQEETTFDFITPPRWGIGLEDMAAAEARLAGLERRIDDEVYRLYGISAENRAAIEEELKRKDVKRNDVEPGHGGGDEESAAPDEMRTDGETGREAANAADYVLRFTSCDLAVRWIGYAVGVVLGRFVPGAAGALGRAVYRREDFAVGSLPAPDDEEFDRLVGPAEHFAWVDEAGGRHLFPAAVEAALRGLALADGIAVLDPGHPRHLPVLVERALALMLGEVAADRVIEAGAGGELGKFLEKDFFTGWHLKWYRKRPVYWPLQSARRGYGFVLFHERVHRDTLYVLQRDYLDHKLNGVRLGIGDLQGQLPRLGGTARKQAERQLDRANQLLEELDEFAKTTARIVRQGYEPGEDWIDDGVILRLAPLWELLPLWKSEPSKHWQRLERGDFDWSHIAMSYWPDRVREKCRADKSLAIAHRVAGG